jgi:hypothetical protein
MARRDVYRRGRLSPEEEAAERAELRRAFPDLAAAERRRIVEREAQRLPSMAVLPEFAPRDLPEFNDPYARDEEVLVFHLEPHASPHHHVGPCDEACRRGKTPHGHRRGNRR